MRVISIHIRQKSDFNSMNFSRESRGYFPGFHSPEKIRFPGISRPGNSREATLGTSRFIIYTLAWNILIKCPQMGRRDGLDLGTLSAVDAGKSLAFFCLLWIYFLWHAPS